jgi:hypothetical protein
MGIYSTNPVRLTFQLFADMFVVAWIVGCTVLGNAAYELVMALQEPVRVVVSAGERIRDTFDGAADTVVNVPWVGGGLADALGNGTGAGQDLATAGQQQLDTIANVAGWAMAGVIILGALPVVTFWLQLRLKYILRNGL